MTCEGCCAETPLRRCPRCRRALCDTCRRATIDLGDDETERVCVPCGLDERRDEARRGIPLEMTNVRISASPALPSSASMVPRAHDRHARPTRNAHRAAEFRTTRSATTS